MPFPSELAPAYILRTTLLLNIPAQREHLPVQPVTLASHPPVHTVHIVHTVPMTDHEHLPVALASHPPVHTVHIVHTVPMTDQHLPVQPVTLASHTPPVHIVHTVPMTDQHLPVQPVTLASHPPVHTVHIVHTVPMTDQHLPVQPVTLASHPPVHIVHTVPMKDRERLPVHLSRTPSSTDPLSTMSNCPESQQPQPRCKNRMRTCYGLSA